jgi:hypothetical protein
MLPDLILLEIFDFYVHEDPKEVEAWHTLVHVCQNWRNIVFGSPRRLDLQLYCTASTPLREMLDVWPQLPVFISVNGQGRCELWGKGHVDNLIAALEHNDRICRLDLNYMPSKKMGNLFPTMEQPFPALKRLKLHLRSRTPWDVPALLLGGSAPHLQTLILDQIQFPGLPKLLLSATHLVHLRLREMYGWAFISPEEMATCLSVLTRLERLEIGFDHCSNDESHWRRPPQLTRTLLPALTELRFFPRDICRYMEDLMSRIDAPLLHKFIFPSRQPISDTPQLIQFIDRTPKFKKHDAARMVITEWRIWVTFLQTVDGRLESGISCEVPDWRLSSVAQACISSLPLCLIPAVEHLYIQNRPRSKRFWDGISRGAWEDDAESSQSQWLDIFQPFTAVKCLYISRAFVKHIASALQKLVGERATEVLPALQTLLFEESLSSGPVKKAIEQFISARRLANRPIAISLWEYEDQPDWVYLANYD